MDDDTWVGQDIHDYDLASTKTGGSGEHSAAAIAHRANVARLEQLKTDALAKLDTLGGDTDRAYYLGFHAGLDRAVKVLEGKG